MTEKHIAKRTTEVSGPSQGQILMGLVQRSEMWEEMKKRSTVSMIDSIVDRVSTMDSYDFGSGLEWPPFSVD